MPLSGDMLVPWRVLTSSNVCRWVGRWKAFADGWKRPSPSTASSEAFQGRPSSMQVGQEEIHQIHPNHRKVLTTYSGPIINIIKLWESSHFARGWTTRTSIAGLFFFLKDNFNGNHIHQDLPRLAGIFFPTTQLSISA